MYMYVWLVLILGKAQSSFFFLLLNIRSEEKLDDSSLPFDDCANSCCSTCNSQLPTRYSICIRYLSVLLLGTLCFSQFGLHLHNLVKSVTPTFAGEVTRTDVAGNGGKECSTLLNVVESLMPMLVIIAIALSMLVLGYLFALPCNPIGNVLRDLLKILKDVARTCPDILQDKILQGLSHRS